MNLTSVHNSLYTKLQKAGKTSPSFEKRYANIKWVEGLQRTGLCYAKSEKQIFIVETEHGEELYIQYPGKESDTRYKNPPNLLDFRPKLFYKDKNSYHEDLTFDHIWEELEDISNQLDDRESIRVLATLLYRMAFMIDHKKLSGEQTIKVKYIDDAIIKESTEKLAPWHRYAPPKEASETVSKKIPSICGMSLDAFLFYIELLSWNEDCKYHYRNERVAREKQKRPQWIGDTGRVNTLLTIIHFLGILTHEVKVSKLFNKFARFGVAGARKEDILQICKGFIHE